MSIVVVVVIIVIGRRVKFAWSTELGAAEVAAVRGLRQNARNLRGVTIQATTLRK